jgi:hypothetical protein
MQNNATSQNDSNHPVKLPTPDIKSPLHYVKYFGDLIKSAVLALFWIIVGCVALTLTVISLTALYWVARLILHALGV